MKTNIHTSLKSLFSVAVVAMALTGHAEIKMPAMFSDNMLMQRDTDALMWGTADPSSKVTVTPSWNDKTYTTSADRTGSWSIALPTPGAGGPYTITVSDGKPVTISNVLLGDLWLCSGQSNMEMPMKGFKNQPIDGGNMVALRSTDPDLRLFTVKRNSTTTPVDTVTGKWQEANPASVRDFSATAYFFGRQLRETLDVPVGLIVAAWGGSACEAWMSDDMLKAFPEAAARIPAVGGKIESKNRTPSVLYKGMLNPLIGMAIKGVIWYQGEDNWNRAHSYADMFSTMIRGWRNDWGRGEFPFYYCQIAPYDYSLIVEEGKPLYNSAYLREAQAKVQHMVPNTGMAVLMDAGWDKGIHPSDKRTPGERLALLALNKTYGVEGIASESPEYKSMEVRNDTVIVSFDRAPEWIAGKHSFESTQFKLAGEDKVFHPAKAWISRSKVMVKSDKVPHPVAVRYAFEDASEGDLYGDGLPVSSFRSDDWPDPQPLKK